MNKKIIILSVLLQLPLIIFANQADSLTRAIVNKYGCLEIQVSDLVRVNNLDSVMPVDKVGLSKKCGFLYPYVLDEWESRLAIHPLDPNIQAVMWHDGSYVENPISITFDGGKSWKETVVPFNKCLIPSGLAVSLATDPSIQITNDGKIFASSTLFNNNCDVPVGCNYIVVVRGIIDKTVGIKWEKTIVLQKATLTGVMTDRDNVTVDINNNNFVYVIWTFFDKNSDGLSFFSRTTNGGNTWEKSRNIYNPINDKPGRINKLNIVNAECDPNKIAVLPSKFGGTLINLMNRLFFTNSGKLSNDLAVIKSNDKGLTWDNKATIFSTIRDNGIDILDPIDPDLNHMNPNETFIFPKNPNGSSNLTAQGFRYVWATWLPQITINKNNGTIYVAHINGVYTEVSGVKNVPLPRIYLNISRDGGKTWSSDMQVSRTGVDIPVLTPGANQSFNTAVSILPNNLIGITYYDFRFYTGPTPANQPISPLLTDYWLAIYEDTGKELVFKTEVRLTNNSFDIRWTRPTFTYYRMGDYVDLVGSQDTFYAAFCLGNNIKPHGINIQTKECLPYPYTNTGHYPPYGPCLTFPQNHQDIYYRSVKILNSK